jgi:hypothetical protein
LVAFSVPITGADGRGDAALFVICVQSEGRPFSLLMPSITGFDAPAA